MRFKCLKNQGEIKRNTFSVIAIFQKVVCSLIFRPSIRLHCVTYKFSRPIFSTISIWRSPLRWHCETRPSLYVNFAPIRGGSRTDLNQKGRYHHLFSPSKTYLVEQGRLMLPELITIIIYMRIFFLSREDCYWRVAVPYSFNPSNCSCHCAKCAITF